MNEDIEKIIEYFKNNNWYWIFNVKEHNDEPYKLLLPTEVIQLVDYITQLQNNWNELKNSLKEQLKDYNPEQYIYTPEYISKMVAYEFTLDKMQELQGDDKN